MDPLPKRIANRWEPIADTGVERASILQAARHPEGVDVDRYRFGREAELILNLGARLISLHQGEMTLDVGATPLTLGAGMHVYVPPGTDAVLKSKTGCGLVVLSAPETQARATRVIVRDETFLSACAIEDQPLRWILTPQYLSRRVFLFHDAVIASKSGHPVSWFRTTMFDVTGLPANDEGEAVFKMSYNHRTEPNVCYDVSGEARVRMAEHPYADTGQVWGSWLPLDSQTTYHLNETEGRPHRNKHEVRVVDGSATLFCLFDPAPTGVEEHTAGAYSGYGPLDEVLESERYLQVQKRHGPFDEMVETLSQAKAEGRLDSMKDSLLWKRFEEGLAAQRRYEQKLVAAQTDARRLVIEPWRLAPASPPSP